MGYSSIDEVDRTLAQALTSARPETPDIVGDLVNIGNTRDLNQIPNEVVQQYIRFADGKIDGVLSQQYYTPLIPCASGQWDLDADINEYNQNVEISDTGNLVVGEKIVIRNDDTGDEEFHYIATIEDQYTLTVTVPIGTVFDASNEVRVIRLKYPSPVPQISVRYAAAFIYDKYFAAQASPNVSDYGNKMRDEAMQDMNNILNGRAILACQRRRGDRFGNSYLDDSFSLRDRGFDKGRDMSKLS